MTMFAFLLYSLDSTDGHLCFFYELGVFEGEDWAEAEDCYTQAVDTFLREGHIHRVGVSDLGTAGDNFLCNEEDVAESERRCTPTGPC